MNVVVKDGEGQRNGEHAQAFFAGRRALPQPRTRMAVYLREGELEEHLTALEQLIRS